MKAITNRIRRLEIRLSPQLDLEGYSLARILYERRRRRREREGVAAEELPPSLEPPTPGFNPMRLTLSLEETHRRRCELREAQTGQRA